MAGQAGLKIKYSKKASGKFFHGGFFIKGTRNL